MTALPHDIAQRQRLLTKSRQALALAQEQLRARDRQIEALKLQIAKLKRMQFGRSSERLDARIAQLELALDALESGQPIARSAPAAAVAPPRTPKRRALPREEVPHRPEPDCPECGGMLHALGEDVTELLEYEPARFKVIRHVRPKLACGACQTVVQWPAPSRPIARGLAGPGLLAHVLVSKYADHLPLSRQSALYARERVERERSTLADWVARTSVLLAPLVAAVGRCRTSSIKRDRSPWAPSRRCDARPSLTTST